VRYSVENQTVEMVKQIALNFQKTERI